MRFPDPTPEQLRDQQLHHLRETLTRVYDNVPHFPQPQWFSWLSTGGRQNADLPQLLTDEHRRLSPAAPAPPWTGKPRGLRRTGGAALPAGAVAAFVSGSVS